ncbi:MAG: DUF2304 domain-containing protein [Fibrobacterota bacterium]
MLLPIHQYLFFAIGAVILFAVIVSVRRNRLSAEFALLWVVTALFLMAQMVGSAWMERLCLLLHLQPAALIFILFGLFALAILFHYSRLLSAQARIQRDLLQRLALLEGELEEKKADATKGV